jgi:hypothetical protein
MTTIAIIVCSGRQDMLLLRNNSRALEEGGVLVIGTPSQVRDSEELLLERVLREVSVLREVKIRSIAPEQLFEVEPHESIEPRTWVHMNQAPKGPRKRRRG